MLDKEWKQKVSNLFHTLNDDQKQQFTEIIQEMQIHEDAILQKFTDFARQINLDIKCFKFDLDCTKKENNILHEQNEILESVLSDMIDDDDEFELC